MASLNILIFWKLKKIVYKLFVCLFVTFYLIYHLLYMFYIEEYNEFKINST